MIFADIYTMCAYYYLIKKPGDKFTVTNTIKDVNISFNIYILSSNYIFSSNNQISSLMNLCGSPGYGQVIIGKEIIINSGITLSPPNRCKGFYIFCKQLTNNGTISMTLKGSEGWGQNVYLWKNQYVPATGALGGESVTYKNYVSDYWYGAGGHSGVNRQTGGGGAGAVKVGLKKRTHTTGQGGYGTSWSGGLGAGGLAYPGSNGRGNAGDTINGYGGNGKTSRNGSDGGGCFGGGGASILSNGGLSSSINGGGKRKDQTCWESVPSTKGSAGLLTIFTKDFKNYGNITSNGGNAAQGAGNADHFAGGGGSGGGSINLFYYNNYNSGTTQAIGGSGQHNGGWGGNGTVTFSSIQNSWSDYTYLSILLELGDGSFNKIMDNEYIDLSDIGIEGLRNIIDICLINNNIDKNLYKTFNDLEYDEDNDYNYYTNANQKKIIAKFYRKTFNVTVTNGFASKNPYRWGEITKIYYKSSSNNPLVKFKNWKTDDVELPISISRICNFVMPIHNVSISAEFEDQDRLNSNIYKDMFEKEIFELYDRLNNKYLLDLLTQKNNTVFQINHNLDLYDLVYLNENGVYKKGLATEEKYQVLGIVSEIINENEFILTLYGPIDYDYNFESDSGILYLSDSIEGAFCSYEDITTAFYTPIGYYKNNQIVINILDSSIGRELKLYQDELFKDITFNYITENDINDIVSEVISKENRVDEVEPETPDEPEEPEEG